MPEFSSVRTASTIATQGSNTPRSLTTSSATALLRSLTGQYEGPESKKGWSDLPGPNTYKSSSKQPKKQKSFFEMDLAGGGAAAKAAEIFKKYDQDGTGDIDPAEMTQALRELGVLEGVPAKEAGRVLAAEMKSADLDSDGRIDFREFIMYFERLARWRAQQARAGRLNARQNSAVPPGWDGNPGLRKAFQSFCQLGKKHGVVRGAGRETIATARMTAQQFMQLCRGTGLVEPTGTLSPSAVDVIFATCKSTGARTLTFKGWLESMAIIADEVNMSFEEVAARFGAKRKTEAVDRPDTAPGRQTARLSPRMSPRMSLQLNEMDDQEQDRRIPARHDMKDVQSKVSSAWKSRAPASDDYTLPSSRERPYTAGSQASTDRSRPANRGGGMSALQRLESGISGNRTDQRGQAGGAEDMVAATLGGAAMQTNHLFTTQPLGPSASPAITDGMRSELAGLKADLYAGLDDRIAAALEEHAKATVEGGSPQKVTRLQQRLDAMETEVGAWSQRIADTQQSSVAMKQLEGRINSVSSLMQGLADDMQKSGGSSDSLKAVDERQGRLENAIMQMARRIDAVDFSLRQEQQRMMQALQDALSGGKLEAKADHAAPTHDENAAVTDA